MFLEGAKLHQPGRILLPVSSSRTGRPIARSAEELSSTWPGPADITVDLDHRPNWTERIVALRLRPTVGDLRRGLDGCRGMGKLNSMRPGLTARERRHGAASPRSSAVIPLSSTMQTWLPFSRWSSAYTRFWLRWLTGSVTKPG